MIPKKGDYFGETYKAEVFAIKILSEFLNVNEKEFEHLFLKNKIAPFDIKFNNLKYDVKFANPTLSDSKKSIKSWTFDIRHKQNYCNFLVLIGMDENLPMKLFLIPAINIPKKHLRVSINGKSKWHRFQIWERK